MAEDPFMTDEDHVKAIGAAISQDQATHWSFDKRIPIFSVGALILAGSVTVGGWLFLAGGMQKTFADTIEKVTAQDERIARLEAGAIRTNLDISDMRGDVKQILALLHQNAAAPKGAP
jgi:hypothetical protein